MNIDVKEISKITLNEGELLWISLDEKYSGNEIHSIAETLYRILPKEWHRRIVLGAERIKLTKIIKGASMPKGIKGGKKKSVKKAPKKAAKKKTAKKKPVATSPIL